MNKEAVKVYYAAWWRRFAALMIDGLVCFPLMLLQMWIGRISPSWYAALIVPFCFIYLGYEIYCHGRWGKTIGKLVTGTRVARLEGSHISWGQAFLRKSVDVLFTAATWFVLIPAYLDIPTEGYADLTKLEQSEMLHSLCPAWYLPMIIVYMGWVGSEFVVILLNKRRRALHDFIAGTIVVQKKPTRRQVWDELPCYKEPYKIKLTKEMKELQKL